MAEKSTEIPPKSEDNISATFINIVLYSYVYV